MDSALPPGMLCTNARWLVYNQLAPFCCLCHMDRESGQGLWSLSWALGGHKKLVSSHWSSPSLLSFSVTWANQSKTLLLLVSLSSRYGNWDVWRQRARFSEVSGNGTALFGSPTWHPLAFQPPTATSDGNWISRHAKIFGLSSFVHQFRYLQK